jgi:hypothetical protein
MKRIYHPHTKLEEVACGMWRIVTSEERERFKQAAAALMNDTEAFEQAMRKASMEWPFSCEHNLTELSMNRIAWLGHAGCCVALGSPEDATRAGWWLLDQFKQDRANEASAKVIREWEARQCQSDNLELTF